MPRHPSPTTRTQRAGRPWGLARAAFAALLTAGVMGQAAAKLPVPPETPESKARAQEARERAAAAAKREAELLSRYQDRAAENYKSRPAK